MTLHAGVRLGPYEIVAHVGSGGMGEVYKARDTRLQRDVAIKVLPALFARDPDRMARLEQEARAAAALNAPGIVAVHDIGTHLDGGQPLLYVVMELLDGESLRTHLDEGAIPPRKAAEYAAQIASALAVAHARGIVHRDLKPENLFLTKDGRITILDFGLAKEMSAIESEASQATGIGTTAAGTVLGTVGYMAPEQVTGQVADARADIFALGCVLYEMASGRRAFSRATVPETMTAILREEPAAVPDSVARPAAFDSVVHRCLEKKPSERFQSARDLAFALRSIAGATSSGERSVTGVLPVTASAPWRSRALKIAGATAAAIALVIAGRQTASRGTMTPAAGPVFASFDKVTDEPGVETTPCISPDGKSVVYAKTVGADTALFLLRVGARTPLRLSGAAPAHDTQPAFSPDGDRIAFRSERDGGGVFLMSVSGESVTRLSSAGFSPQWSPDGTEIVVAPGTFGTPTDIGGTSAGLTVIAVASGQTRPLAIPQRALQPSWSPGGKRIAFWGVIGRSGQRDIRTVAADGSDAGADGVAVTDDPDLDWSPEWSPDGRWLYFSSTRGGTVNLWRIAIDQQSGKVLSEPEPMTTPSIWSGYLSFSRDGSRAVFASVDYRSTLLRVPFDAAREAVTGPAEPILKGTRPIRDHSVSPDGQWVAFSESGKQEDLFVARVDGSEYRRLTDDGFRDRGPSWSPDGSRIAFYSDRSGTYDMWMIRPDGSELTQMTKSTGNPGFPVWSPDGSRIAYGYFSWQIVNPKDAPIESPVAEPPMSERERFNPMTWSRDGVRLAGPVLVDGGLATSLGIFNLTTLKYSRLPGEFGASSIWLTPVWLADNRRLIVRRADGIAVVNADTGAGRMLIPVGGYTVGMSVGLSPDNKWITYTETATEGDVWIANLTK